MSAKEERKQKVLLGLVELYIQSGRPIGSNTLKEAGFENLSSATIRNYFSSLEEDGYLVQHHASGGRTPTDRALKLYALNHQDSKVISANDDLFLDTLLNKDTKEIATYFQQALEALSEVTSCAVFMTSPRFDQDFVTDVKLLAIDSRRTLCAIMTDFGMVHTEILYTPTKLSNFSLHRIEEHFRYRITDRDKPKLSKEESQIASQWYNEIILRYIVSYTNFHHDDFYKAGFHKLLRHSEFHDPASLSNTLSLFETPKKIETLLNDTFKEGKLKFWVGEDLAPYINEPHSCSLITIPFTIQSKVVGTIALLGPLRIPYDRLFGIMRTFSKYLSENLTKSICTHKLTYRERESGFTDISTTHHLLIENQGGL